MPSSAWMLDPDGVVGLTAGAATEQPGLGAIAFDLLFVLIGIAISAILTGFRPTALVGFLPPLSLWLWLLADGAWSS